ncbi:reverse transcriptase [Gossypium australe]|uniref:Reverse transcriptase n=1 Tax=Gossypium australe TaxID=47621 RepID=A0A5B6W0Z0_9ROSI|nr:reverse transcriptase [Gossypium australe]
MKCISTVSYAVIGNIFYLSRGLRQGDLLSPFLFLICGEGLSNLMILAQQEENFRGVKASRRGPQISHLLFADDCILFSEATERGADLLKRVLREYRTCSGQQVNFDKSTVFFSSNTKVEDKDLVTHILGMQSSNNLGRYLELPNMVGRRKKEAFQILKNRFRQRIDNWSVRHPSQGGKKFLLRLFSRLYQRTQWHVFYFLKRCALSLKVLSQDSGGRKVMVSGEFIGALEGSYAFRRKKADWGWRLINYPDSLLAQVQLGNLPSLTWRSIWVAKKLLKDGLCWRIRKRDRVSVWNDYWIPNVGINGIENRGNNTEIESVSGLIDTTTRMWKRGLIETTFPEHIAQKMLQIPLIEVEHEDFQVWRGEHSVNDSVCPRCRNTEEDSNHVLRQCPTAIELWQDLNISWVINSNITDLWSWFTCVFDIGSNNQCRIFCCAAWMLWFSRNKLVHEGKTTTRGDLSQRVMNYIVELDRSNERKHTFEHVHQQSQARKETKATIFFDVAFDSKNSKSALGLEVRGEMNDWLSLKTVIHSAISSPFTAEAQAGLQATKLGISMGFQTVTIIGDSKSVIKKCNSAEADKSVLGAIINDIQRYKQFFQECYFRFVSRLENGEAHNIAVEALRTGEKMYLESETFISLQTGGEENGVKDPD